MFCGKMVQRLLRHLRAVHADADEVKALNAVEGDEQRVQSDNLRKKGILKWNQLQAEKETPNYEAERIEVKDKVLCSSCDGFYSRRLFYRHKAKCSGDSSSVGMDLTYIKKPDTFFSSVASKIQSDEIGVLAKSDPFILLIGERLFFVSKKKVNKDMEMRHTTMGSMRLLARLLLGFRQEGNMPGADASYLFDRRNFPILEVVVQAITTKEDGVEIKHGLKQKVLYLLRSAANILKGSFRAQMKDKEADEVDYFLEVLSLNQNSLFGDAAFAVMKSRHEHLRMPEQIPEEDNVALLRNFMLQQIKEMTTKMRFSIPELNDFVMLRDSLCARVTLFNGRRGNETSLMEMKHMEDALSKRWVKQATNLNAEDAQIVSQFLITYMPGKGNKMVPVIIPPESIEGLKIICDTAVRKEIGVHVDNKFVFASTGQSMNHVKGWPCINNLCDSARVENPQLLTATKQRHRLSTRFASLDLTNRERQLFYDHLGHEAVVNETTYQHPQAVSELTVIGRHLRALDEGEAVPCHDNVINHNAIYFRAY